RNTMDNGATVLDILGGDNYIGLGRSSLSGQSLSGIFMNMKEKVLAWKPDVIRLWNFPKEMKNFTIDSQKYDRFLRQPFPPAAAAAGI
ncbi:hypothetical protein K41_05430, partial [Klebsiella pneumoniae]